MLCVINWKKITSNKFMGNQQCNSHLPFPGQHYSFQGFFQTFPGSVRTRWLCHWSKRM